MSHNVSEQLATTLMRIRDANYTAPENYWVLTQIMLQPGNIGNRDPALRDELIYATLANWIANGTYTQDQLRSITKTAVDEEHLLHNLGSQHDDSILVRSFSVLLIPPVLARHQQKSLFEPMELLELARTLDRYLQKERDLRGYDNDTGWIHAIAHTADAVYSLLNCREVNEPTIKLLLERLQTTASTPHHVYAHGEEERLAQAMATGLYRQELSTAKRTVWLEGFRTLVEASPALGMPKGYARIVNINHTLRALYFSVRNTTGPADPAIHTKIEELLTDFSKL